MRIKHDWDDHAILWAIRSNPPKLGMNEPDWDSVAASYTEITGVVRNPGAIRRRALREDDPAIFGGMSILDKAGVSFARGKVGEAEFHHLDEEADKIRRDIKASRSVRGGCMRGDTREQELAARSKSQGLIGAYDGPRPSIRETRDPRRFFPEYRRTRIESDSIRLGDQERERYWV